MSRRIKPAELLWTVVVFAAVVAALWILDPGTEQTWALTHASGCIVLSTWLNTKRVPLWVEASPIAVVLGVLVLWRVAGAPLWAALAAGVAVQLAVFIVYFRRASYEAHDAR